MHNVMLILLVVFFHISNEVHDIQHTFWKKIFNIIQFYCSGLFYYTAQNYIANSISIRGDKLSYHISKPVHFQSEAKDVRVGIVLLNVLLVGEPCEMSFELQKIRFITLAMLRFPQLPFLYKLKLGWNWCSQAQQTEGYNRQKHGAWQRGEGFSVVTVFDLGKMT